MTSLLTDNLPLLASAPNGIRKLRELILELAVRGKLVPQDSCDEPASELLKRIAAKKVRLAAEGQIKAAKLLEGGVNEVSYAIPSTWAAAPLGEVVEIVRGITFPASEKSRVPEPGRVACLRTTNVQSEIEWEDLLYIRASFVSRSDQYVQPHDIVMSMANSRELVGKVALIGEKLKQKTTIGGFLGVLRPVLIEPRFVMALLRTPTARNALIASSSQTTNIANVSLAKLRPLPFAIPPLAEQKRIVAKVDELMVLCDTLEAQQANAESARTRLVQALLDSLTQTSDGDDFGGSWQRLSKHFHTLFTTESSVDALELTLLQLAVMGKLVPQVPSDEPATKLLRRISKAKMQLLSEGKLREQKAQRASNQSCPPSELPDSWVWSSLAEAALVNPRNAAIDSLEVSFVPMTLIGTRFDSPHGQERRLWSEVKQGFTHFAEGDIGVAKITPCFENSKACVFSNLTNGLGAGTTELHIVRTLNGTLDPRYVLAYLKSPQFLVIGGTKMTGTAGQKRLPKDFVEGNPFPLPPLAEQHRIVAKLDQVIALCDRLKSCLVQSRQLNEVLASTLVEHAVA